MKTVIALSLLLVSVSACRVFRYSEWRRRDACAETLPILDDKPTAHFEIVRAVHAGSDYDLRWKACAEEADAVVRVGIGSSFSGWAFSSSAVLQGVAIKYDRPAVAQGE